MAGSDNVAYVYLAPAVSIYQRNDLQAHVNISRYGNPAGSGRRTRPPGPPHPGPVRADRRGTLPPGRGQSQRVIFS